MGFPSKRWLRLRSEAENLYLVEYSLACRSGSLRIHLSTLPRLRRSHQSKPSYKSQHIFIHFLRSRLSDKNCEIPAKFSHKFQFLMEMTMEAVMEMAFGRQFGGPISESVTHKLLSFIIESFPSSRASRVRKSTRAFPCHHRLTVSPSPHRNFHLLRQFTLSSPSSAPLSAKHN